MGCVILSIFTIPVFATLFICIRLALSLMLKTPLGFTFTKSVTVRLLVEDSSKLPVDLTVRFFAKAL